MDNEPRDVSPSGADQAWDTARRIREPVAWTFLVLVAIVILVSAGQLLGAVGVPTPAPATFAVRASAMGPQFVDFGLVTMALLSVILVAFAGGLTDRARQVVQAAVWIEAVGLGLGVISFLAAFGAHTRPGAWFIFFAVDLAIAATALVFTVAVARSQALQAPPPLYHNYGGDDEEEFGDDGEDLGGDAVEFGAP
jgi:hypothetical protein